ncbi:MAG: dihydropteroate synthase [Candidatus Eisenbacteria sp.]|nr:dihydropteroate synthase [Candidatus Eisenbacteria bacterium]
MEQLPSDRVRGSAPRYLACGAYRLPLESRTLVAGVLNVTPDSFYDGGRYSETEAAVARAHEMVREGADLIDIGGQSSRPFSKPVTEEEELARIGPVLDRLQGRIDVPVSIDTCRSGVARYAISRGACIVNDITALTHDREMLPLVAGEGVAVVLMHMRGAPGIMQVDTRYDDLVGEVKSYLFERASAVSGAGLESARIVIDPGIGFGKSVEGNLELLRRLSELKELGYPVLVGASRKSFIGLLLGVPEEERLEGSLGAAAAAVMNGADVVRVHDVKQTVQAIRVVDAIRREESKSCLR